MIQLMSLVPPVATIVNVSVREGAVAVDPSALLAATSYTAPTSAIQRGSIVVVLPSARIPADGLIVHGESDVDEQVVTGESVPRFVQPGDRVTGGS